MDPAAPEEVREVLWRHKATLASYVCRPDAEHGHNAWLYLCENQGYRLEDLGPPARRDTRRALRSFRFGFVDPPKFLELGVEAYCDTRRRIGFSDGVPDAFRKKYARFAENPAHRVVGAWAGESLAGYATLVVVDDWVEIYPYAADDHLKGCPVNGLVHFVLDYFLVQNMYRLVNYGLSSIQEETKAQSLHAFKKKVGFECHPVHRAFVLHPLLQPLANPMSLWTLRACTRLFPGSDVVSRAAGVISTCLGNSHLPVEN